MFARYNWPHSFSCVARCLKRQISCHCQNKCYVQLSQSHPIPAKFTNIETCTLLCYDHITLWKALMQTWWKTVLTALKKHQNSSKISMDRLIKVDEKTSVSNIIHVSYLSEIRQKLVCCVNIQHQKSLMLLNIERSVKDRYRENYSFRDSVSRSRRHLAMVKSAMVGLNKIWVDRA